MRDLERSSIPDGGAQPSAYLMSGVRFLATLFALACVSSASAQQAPGQPERTDLLAGTVTTDSGVPVPGADVIATRAPDRTSFATKTDERGRYRLEIRGGTGDYLIYASAVGRTAVRKRLTRTNADSVLRLDIALPPAGPAQELAVVQVSARRRTISRESTADSEAGGAEEGPPGLYGAVPPGLEGSLDALAATIPGIVALAEGGFSALGLDASNNSATLNGMFLGASDIPRDAKKKTAIATTTYDPARGWFSGAEVAVTLQPGSVFSFRRSHLTMDLPALQLPDKYAQVNGGRFTNVQLSTGGDGPLTRNDKYVYSYAVQGSVRSEPITSLSADAGDVARFTGISSESAGALLGGLAASGVPITSASSALARRTNALSVIGRVDHAPYDWKTFTPSRRMFGLLAYANLGQSGAVGVGPATTNTYGGSRTRSMGMLQAHYSSYDSAGRLLDFRSALTVSNASSSTYLALPSASALIHDESPAGTRATVVSFGSDPMLDDEWRAWTWETSANRQTLVGRAQGHRIKLSATVRIDGYADKGAVNRLGRFTFASLDDLIENTPSTFTRTSDGGDNSGRVANAFVALGDSWQVNEKFSLMYGGRMDASQFLIAARKFPEVEQAFGVTTGYLPNGLALSPRIGFTWVLRPSGGGLRVSPIGLFGIGPSSYLRGGIGRFRNLTPPAITLGRSGPNFAGSQTSRISCVGPSAPTPDWASYLEDVSRIPNECAGDPASVFATGATDVAFLDPGYQPPSSWRGNLAYGSYWSKLAYSIEGVYSLNVDQASRIDLNFRNEPGFLLAAEDDRPVYAPLTAVDPRTGAISSSGSRNDVSFGRVAALRSDARSVSRQLTFRVSPHLESLGNWYASMAYTLSSVRQLQRGYSASTFSSPTTREWSRGDFVSRHQILLQGGVGNSAMSLTFFGILASGTPFTPLIASDVNGDGSANDRAFIFDPARSSASGAAGDLQALMTSAAPRIRRCLERQLDDAAGHNSCRGPWSASLNAQVKASGRTLGLGRRVDVSLGIINPLGGLDQLFNGGNRLRGWGTRAAPDPALLRVRAFDPASREFRYDVNANFGSTARSNVALRVPFRLTLDISVDIGTPVPVQQIDKWLSPGRGGRPGPRLRAEDIKRRYSRSVQDPYDLILEESDSLLLSPDQIDSLIAVQLRYQTRRDSLWTSLATYLAALGDRFDADDALRRAEATTDAVWEMTRADIQRTLPRILNPIQLRMMPGAGLFNSRGPIRGRTYGNE